MDIKFMINKLTGNKSVFEGKIMTEKQEGNLSIIAALLVLFTAMIVPPVSAILAMLLVGFAVYNIQRAKTSKGK